MRNDVRSSLPAKLTACGFILMVLLGNYWMVLAILAQDYPAWLMDAFLATALFLVGCGVCLAFLSFREPPPEAASVVDFDK